MNKVDSLVKTPFRSLNLEVKLEIKRISPYQPRDIIITQKDATELSQQLDTWLSQADLTHGPARAIIAPHAGYQYSGSVSAFAYRQISPIVVKRVFVLGPSHHVRLSGCALSPLSKYRTPLYDLAVDQQVYNDLYGTEHFETMSVTADEDEHSIEMHLPYIAKVMEDFRDQFTIVPILVGSLSQEKESIYGRVLAPYLADPQNLFVVSSDFCHWGQRFRYTYYDRSAGEIWQSIQKLDKQGMSLIETLNPSAFTDYLRKFGNTICGRHPIGVLLNTKFEENFTGEYPRFYGGNGLLQATFLGKLANIFLHKHRKQKSKCTEKILREVEMTSLKKS